MKKKYEKPTVEIEEFELENSLGNLCIGSTLDPNIDILEDPKQW